MACLGYTLACRPQVTHVMFAAQAGITSYEDLHHGWHHFPCCKAKVRHVVIADIGSGGAEKDATQDSKPAGAAVLGIGTTHGRCDTPGMTLLRP